jgi:hypothetical protein
MQHFINYAAGAVRNTSKFHHVNHVLIFALKAQPLAERGSEPPDIWTDPQTFYMAFYWESATRDS